MTRELDETHDPCRQSWVVSANAADTDFPIQNLPFGRFKRNAHEPWRICVAIGDQVLDVLGTGLVTDADINKLMAVEPSARRALRRKLSFGLMVGSDLEQAWSAALYPVNQVTLGVPCDIGDYSDFYVGIHHATSVGRLFRPDSPLLPNYKWVPIGYHGRASTIGASGHGFRRPLGQVKSTGQGEPTLLPTQRLDFELELAVFVGKPNRQGEPISIADAEDHVFGMALFNDWSARDLQLWEYQPLGPFLSKNFASTVSPWIVTLEALAPFRRGFKRPDGDPKPLAYLDSLKNTESGAFDIEMEVRLQTSRMRELGMRGELISSSNFADAAYWTVAQLIAHHSVNGCALNAGDLLGSGTLSGAYSSQAGSLLELTRGGMKALRLNSGEDRLFLLDGDSIELIGRCRRDGYRSIGFGSCVGTVFPSPVRKQAAVGSVCG